MTLGHSMLWSVIKYIPDGRVYGGRVGKEKRWRRADARCLNWPAFPRHVSRKATWRHKQPSSAGIGQPSDCRWIRSRPSSERSNFSHGKPPTLTNPIKYSIVLRPRCSVLVSFRINTAPMLISNNKSSSFYGNLQSKVDILFLELLSNHPGFNYY